MTSLAIRASAVKNNDDMKKTSEIRFALLKLPTTKTLTTEPSDSGMFCQLLP